jgi:hypothetical protein
MVQGRSNPSQRRRWLPGALRFGRAARIALSDSIQVASVDSLQLQRHERMDSPYFKLTEAFHCWFVPAPWFVGALAAARMHKAQP